MLVELIIKYLKGNINFYNIVNRLKFYYTSNEQLESHLFYILVWSLYLSLDATEFIYFSDMMFK